jgi:D-threo-aldose 1-dehydrogenase
VHPVFDFSYDAMLRSLEESLERLGLDRVDAVYIHDPDDHYGEALAGAYPALEQLRSERVVRAIGFAMNQGAMLTRFARDGDFDMFMVAGRYTLLEQDTLDDLLPACGERGAALVLGGVLNSGLLVDPRPESTYDYLPAPPMVVARAQRLKAVCERHGVPLPAAAIQFAAAHPLATCVLHGLGRRARAKPPTGGGRDPERTLGGVARRGAAARRPADAPGSMDTSVIGPVRRSCMGSYSPYSVRVVCYV